MNEEALPNGSAPDSEEWFLEQLELPTIDLARLTASLEGLAGCAAMAQADSRSRLLQDVLLERGQFLDALGILRLRASWMGSDKASEDTIRDELLAMAGPDTERRTLVDHIGFGRVAPAEAVRRMMTLIALRDAVPCFDKTWGFGIVKRIDSFEKRVEIDFESKAAHRMTYDYAAETLHVLDESHLLTRFHRDPDGIRAAVRERPGEIVRLALQSFGPMAVVQLQDRLVPRLMAEAEWKPFWDAARKALKKDGTVDIPAKRTEPLRLRDAPVAGDRGWIADLAADRDMASILVRVCAAVDEGRAGPEDAEARSAIAGRLGFVIKGAEGRHPGLVARSILVADRLGLDEGALPVRWRLEAWRVPSAFVTAVHDLPARDVHPFVSMLQRRIGPEFAETLLESVDRLKASVLADVLEILLSEGHEAGCAERIRWLVATRQADVEVLLWLHRNPARWTAWELGRWFDFARLALTAMEKDHCGERLKAQNALRERLAKTEWLKDLFDGLDEDGRREMFLRFKETTAWPSLERQAILGRIVKLWPELEELLRGGAPATVRRLLLTSSRSHRERQDQLRRIVEVDIPQNSRDIGVARSHGDLRENFEYKAAKEAQGILLRRQGELEAALKQVQPTDFDGPVPERAGPGAGVEIEHADGRRERFYVLGAWDRDEALGIISSDTRFAQAVEGHVAGDEIVVPGLDGDRPVRMVAVLPLSNEVRAWVRGGT
jgi:transcription elongation GreA/GreB family factor